MSRFLRSCPCHPTVAEEEVPEVRHCVICWEPMSDPKQVVTLRCAHTFHGQCICNHLVHDRRCPICRDSPYGSSDPNADDNSSVFSLELEDDESPPRGPTLKEAFNAAKRASKTDKLTAKMFDTYRKWKSDATTARKELKTLHNRLRPLEDKLEDKINAYNETQRNNFEEKHKDLISNTDDTRRAVNKCRGHERNAKLRIAKKHGFVPRRRRPWRQSSSDDVSDDVLALLED